MANKALIFLVGFMAGGVASGLYAKKKYEKILKDEQDDISETLSDVTDKEYSDLEPEEESKPVEPPKEYSGNSLSGGRTVEEYYNYGSNYDAGEEMTKESEENSKLAPKIIKASDYGTNPIYEPQTLLYYTDNDVLTTETDEIIGEGEKDLDEIRSVIGDALTKFGFKDSDEDRIFVRNFKRNADYEIIKVFGAFEE